MEYFSREKINNYYPGAHMIPAMKIWKIPEEKEQSKFSEACSSGEYFAELKKDGYWYQYEKTAQGSYLFSRTVSRTTGLLTEKSKNVPHLVKIFEESGLPNDTVIIGEIYYPGKTSKNVTSIMGCLPEEAIKRQEKNGYIYFYIYDIIYCNGVSLIDVSAYSRYLLLEKIYNKYNLGKNGYIQLAQAVTENIEEFTSNAFRNNEEGVVLKQKTALYYPDKRPAWTTIKKKKMDSVDVICIGFCDATKEYEGKELSTWDYWVSKDGTLYKGADGYADFLKGELTPVTKGWFYGWKTAIKIGAIDETGKIIQLGTVSSGLTDELREDFKNNPKLYLNKVVEIQCMEKDSKEHTLRHPFLKRFRDDKNFNECTLKEIF